MTAWTDYAENKFVDWIFRGQAVPALPATWYIGLLSVPSSDAATPLTEVAGGGYARVAVARSLVNFAGTQAAASTIASTGTGGTTSNNAEIVYPAPTADWGNIAAIGLFDAPAGGNLWATGQLNAAKNVSNGDAPPRFPPAALTFQFDN